MAGFPLQTYPTILSMARIGEQWNSMEYASRKSRETLREFYNLVRREIPVCRNCWISIYLIQPSYYLKKKLQTHSSLVCSYFVRVILREIVLQGHRALEHFPLEFLTFIHLPEELVVGGCSIGIERKQSLDIPLRDGIRNLPRQHHRKGGISHLIENIPPNLSILIQQIITTPLPQHPHKTIGKTARIAKSACQPHPTKRITRVRGVTRKKDTADTKLV
jgi:hypothetical protein